MMVLGWLVGDLFKVFYFVLLSQPIQFIACGAVQGMNQNLDRAQDFESILWFSFPKTFIYILFTWLTIFEFWKN